MKLLQAWIELHKDELVADWQLALSGQQPYKIAALGTFLIICTYIKREFSQSHLRMVCLASLQVYLAGSRMFSETTGHIEISLPSLSDVRMGSK
jgi:hypothetical protein